MDERILFNPENRLLASSQANDFSLYGAPPEAILSIGPARTPDAPADCDATAPQAGAAATPQDAIPSIPISSEAAAAGEAFGASALPALGLSPQQAAFTPHMPEPASAGASASYANPGAAAPFAPVAPTQAPAVEQGAAAPAAASAEAPAAAAAMPAGDAGQVLGTFAPAATGPLAEVSLVPAVGAAEEGVADLLGSDPEGGIATLVSLVSISEILDVPQVSDAASTLTAPTTSLVDSLAEDALGEAAPADLDPLEAVESVTPSVPILDDDPLPGGLG